MSHYDENKRTLQRCLRRSISSSLEAIVVLIKATKIAPRELARFMMQNSVGDRKAIYAAAYLHEGIELAQVVKEANKIVDEEKASEFKTAVINGTYQEFLDGITEAQKADLRIILGLDHEDLSEEMRIYKNILDDDMAIQGVDNAEIEKLLKEGRIAPLDFEKKEKNI